MIVRCTANAFDLVAVETKNTMAIVIKSRLLCLDNDRNVADQKAIIVNMHLEM